MSSSGYGSSNSPSHPGNPYGLPGEDSDDRYGDNEPSTLEASGPYRARGPRKPYTGGPRAPAPFGVPAQPLPPPHHGGIPQMPPPGAYPQSYPSPNLPLNSPFSSASSPSGYPGGNVPPAQYPQPFPGQYPSQIPGGAQIPGGNPQYPAYGQPQPTPGRYSSQLPPQPYGQPIPPPLSNSPPFSNSPQFPPGPGAGGQYPFPPPPGPFGGPRY
ncbi:hypothetical protein SISSUDRAFT_1131357 [Sistotremastrum suecicum HHB10207 ss-3]|uniref:Uncharacterized protein n=1 Tax=Sistotremastrum suecicum HHB10207 ss-3 TaxID=1314776 RepID=A0A166A9Q8_9AGAM|nr:hypothetical protein SISSUDRAFT_1131357 [Sistotremastrum suecicum HHB10207 ss-3]